MDTTIVMPETEPQDEYSEAVKYLTERHDEIGNAWLNPTVYKNRGGSLFKHASRAGCGGSFGCLTQIAARIAQGPTKDLTERIKADTRIPKDPIEITPANLHVFAEWQRIIDKEYRNKPELPMEATKEDVNPEVEPIPDAFVEAPLESVA